MIPSFRKVILSRIRQAALALSQTNSDLVAGYLYGSNAGSFLHNLPLQSREIDIMLVSRRELRQGEPPCPITELISTFSLPMTHGWEFLVITNGVPPVRLNEKTWMLDIIGDGLPNIVAKDPSSVIVAKRERILLFGSDVYGPLENEPLTQAGKVTVFRTMVTYASREFYTRSDPMAMRSLAKTALFISFLLDDDALRSQSKGDSALRISSRYPVLSPSLTCLLGIYNDPSSLSPDKCRKQFDCFCEIVERNYFVGGG